MGRRVLLVGYEDQDNLGIRYLSSRLLRDGHHTRIVAFGDDPGPLLRVIHDEQPDLVGFSLIFQYMVPAFARLIRSLRDAGVGAHFTIGGHFASFEPEELLRRIPELDSVVRFEGEDTLAELVAALGEPAEPVDPAEPADPTEPADRSAWQRTAGIAWHDGDRVVVNEARAGRTSLDEFPEPDRRDIDYRGQRLATASVLASRGCPWKCSFCSIITFYAGNSTKGRRRRDPAAVVNEVEWLVRERGAQLVLLQDDDFLAGGPPAHRWAHAIAEEIVARGLQHEMRWKIACRSDEVRTELLTPLIAAGLCHVYLGVESGDEENLRSLNKLLKPSVHVRAGEILRELDLTFDFGYQLLEPWSTLRTVRNNAAFLRRFTADGWAAAGFCRTLPYVGTPVEQRLREEGRLDGSSLEADYRFLDPRLDTLWDFCLVAFEGRNHGAGATWDAMRGLLFDTHLDLPGRPRDTDLHDAARLLAQASNGVMLDVLDDAMDLIELDGIGSVEHPELMELARFARREEQLIRAQMMQVRRPDGAGRELLFR